MSDDLLAGMVQVHRRMMSEQSNDGTLLLTVEQAAKMCQISRGLAYELIARGELPAVRLGRVIRIPRGGLEQWIERQAGLPPAAPEGVDFPQQLPSQRH